MKYEIKGSTVPYVEIAMSSGESVYTQSEGMFYQTAGISMSTNAKGGLLKGIGRVIASESLFMATYKAHTDSRIAFSSTVPGAIILIDVSQGKFIIQKGSFLAAESSVNLRTVFNKRLSSSIWGDEGFILQELSGNQGTALLEVDGDACDMYLGPGEELKVDTGCLVGFQDSIKYHIEMVKGLGNIVFGGEGLFLAKLVGPGRVLLQSMNMNEFALKVESCFSADKKNNGN